MKNLRLPANMAFVGIIGTKLGVVNAMMSFIVTGAIPGTPVTVRPEIMLFLTVAGLWFFVLAVALPLLLRSHLLQVQTPVRNDEDVAVDSVAFSSSQPRFRLFGPVVHVGR